MVSEKLRYYLNVRPDKVFNGTVVNWALLSLLGVLFKTTFTLQKYGKLHLSQGFLNADKS